MTPRRKSPRGAKDQAWGGAVDYTEDHGLSVEAIRARVDQLLREDWSQLSDDDAIDRLGLLVDGAHDTDREDATRVAIERGTALLSRTLTRSDVAKVHYYLANAWSAARCAAGGHGGTDRWDVPEPAQEIIHLRQALQSAEDLGRARGMEDRLLYCQIATNLGNLMSSVGRIVDAIAYWDAALAVDPEFSMAIGNRAYGLVRYGFALHDPGHQVRFFRAGYLGLLRATAPEHARHMHAGARAHFADVVARIRAELPATVLEQPSAPYAFRKRMSQGERAYREWCLGHRLFLNDLNDLGPDPIAAADVLMLPDLTTPFDAPMPSAIGFFNQLKQEYASARFMYYEGVTRASVHFSDREVTLLDTFDYPAYGLAVEQVKAAFRIAYSLFDKVAYLLNDYLGLRIRERDVSFRSLWYERTQPVPVLRAEVHRPDNGLLKGLFWLAKDLYEADPGYAEALEPHARETAVVRNHLEHKYLKLHLFGPPEPPRPGETRISGDDLAFSLDRHEFEQRTLMLLQRARSALIYLSLAVNFEERRRRRDDAGRGRIAVPMPTFLYSDRQKF